MIPTDSRGTTVRTISFTSISCIPASVCRAQDGVLHLLVIIDRFSMEVFVNGGEKVMTMTYYTDIRADRISFLVDGTEDLM